VHELLRRIANYDIAVFDRYLEMGVDRIGFSEDLGSQRALMMSPQTFRLSQSPMGIGRGVAE